MKFFSLSLFIIALLFFSITALAQRVTITGEPVTIEKRDGIYVPTDTVITTNDDYYYFAVDNTRRICYKQIQPGLAKIDAGIMSVKFGETVVDIHCYDYNPEYFVIE